MTDLTTKYLGLTLKNPLIVSASPLTAFVDKIQRLEDAPRPVRITAGQAAQAIVGDVPAFSLVGPGGRLPKLPVTAAVLLMPAV